MASPVNELAGLLLNTTFPSSLKTTAFKHILGLSAAEDGIKFILEDADIVLTVVFAHVDSVVCEELSELAHKCLINISASPTGIQSLCTFNPNVSQWLMLKLQDLECPFVELKCKVISNLSKHQPECEAMANYLLTSSESFGKLLFLFSSNESEMKGNYDYMALFFANLSAVAPGRRLFLRKDYPCLKYILPYTTYFDSDTRRVGAAILLKNVCFEIDDHKWLFDDIEILPFLLLPLACTNDFAEEEMEKLPIELQYLDDSHTQEPLPYIRVMLLQALLKLCCTQYGREYMRSKGTYYILRELHQKETQGPVTTVCEEVIEILMRDEEDLNAENLMDVNVPQHLTEEFQQMTLTTSSDF